MEFEGIGETIGTENGRGGIMKYRIAMWTGAGFLIAVCWALYAFATTPPAMTSADPIVSLVELTCPVVFASVHFHFALGLYWSLLANAATYGLVGLIVERLRQQLHHAS
ncbi:MAG: hypothetical protein ACXVZH_16785 [Terriglobales bacterium]